MDVSATMDLGQLAELMGNDCTQAEATVMRRLLLDDGYYDTDDVKKSEWLEMIRDAAELAEAEEGALPRLSREAAYDGGPHNAR